jgi:hypothetical protein
MILDLLADGEWHELPDTRAVWSAVYRLRKQRKVVAMSREGRLPTERQKYRLR